MGFVGNLSLFAAVKNFTNLIRIDRIIAMVRFAQFFSDSQCIIQTCIITDTAKLITITTWGRDRRIRIHHRLRMRRDNVSGRVCFSLSVCLSVMFRNFIFGVRVHLENIQVKFVYEGHWVKARITGAKRSNDRNKIHVWSAFDWKAIWAIWVKNYIINK